MRCFAIEEQSFNEVKNMAGNIVPAIASTNSIVSGLQVIEMIKFISDEMDKLRSSYVQNQNYKVIAMRT
jgi:ubiquitin-like 1-activating enzyme E1 B